MKHVLLSSFLVLVATVPTVAQMHSPPSMSADRVARAITGEALQFTVRVDSIDRATLNAHVLNPAGKETFSPSKESIAIYAPQTASFVMGTRADLKPGAVLFVYAVSTKPHQADATKIVIDSKYVTVK